jgi:hypothetical protein
MLSSTDVVPIVGTNRFVFRQGTPKFATILTMHSRGVLHVANVLVRCESRSLPSSGSKKTSVSSVGVAVSIERGRKVTSDDLAKSLARQNEWLMQEVDNLRDGLLKMEKEKDEAQEMAARATRILLEYGMRLDEQEAGRKSTGEEVLSVLLSFAIRSLGTNELHVPDEYISACLAGSKGTGIDAEGIKVETRKGVGITLTLVDKSGKKVEAREVH